MIFVAFGHVSVFSYGVQLVENLYESLIVDGRAIACLKLCLSLCFIGDLTLREYVIQLVLFTTSPLQFAQMSLVTDSPVNSSSSDDFAALLDSALDSASSDSSPVEEAKDDDDVEIESIKRHKVENMGSTEEPDGSTSQVSVTEVLEEESTKQNTCTHPGSFGDMCIICGQRLEQESGVTFGYIHKDVQMELSYRLKGYALHINPIGS
ncbi:hypothetical protein FEM48_Zijuj01G0173600 [Ziziphus jujuba var. spinosa]|uniref:Uncharacterized protein n=1 Tax=Ziziphus jujuba var. spinosa TaxID=714518 RepID=A0A978W2K0_ZIZJJ|nr:hypothetical protein FEM48_Zijuj01G0173600 [Ziziphus jujuba var. spinosa]